MSDGKDYIEVDAEIFDKAIHVLKALSFDLHREKNCGIILSENHVAGHVKWAVEMFYDSIK